MDWLIWVIVIVLIVAIVWWLLSRNKAKPSESPISPSSSSPTASSPQMDVASAAVTGSAPLVAATATSEQDLAESRAAEPEPEPAPAAGDVEDRERPAPPLETGMTGTSESPATGSPAEEPEFEEPEFEEPVFEEPTLAEPVLSEDAVSKAPAPTPGEPELEGGVTADDVTAADDGPSGAGGPASGTEAATPEQLADSAEWEATWSEGAPAAAAPIHHREYTDAHAPTLPGAESAAAEAADTSAETAQADVRTEVQADRGGTPGAARSPVEPSPVDESTTQVPDSTNASPLGGHLAAEQPYGEGSAAAGADGSGPDGYTVKGNADTMTYHDEDSPSYDDVKAEVWFVSSAHAEAAGFRPPRRNRR